jgi:hypothetical protein
LSHAAALRSIGLLSMLKRLNSVVNGRPLRLERDIEGRKPCGDLAVGAQGFGAQRHGPSWTVSRVLSHPGKEGFICANLQANRQVDGFTHATCG